MTNIAHIPALRRGRIYESLEKLEIKDHCTGQTMATLSQVNAGIIRKDLQRLAESRAALKKLAVADLMDISAKAGKEFIGGALPLGGQGTQSPDDYIQTLSATSGLPHVIIRRNMAKIHHALANMRPILNGLTRGLELTILDDGFGEQFGTSICFHPRTNALGLVMPSNSPAVNSLWLPAIA